MSLSGRNWRSLTRLEVIYQGWGEALHLGTLATGVDRGRFMFEYTNVAIQRGIEFSPLHQPLSADTYTNFERYQEYLPGFIADSLPDGWGRLLMDRLLRRNNIEPAQVSPLDRLGLLGERTMGALTYRPCMEITDKSATDYDIHDLSELAEQVRLESIGQDSDALPELVRLGGSPHGARPKAVVEYEPLTGRMSTTAFAGSEAWMVKFPGAQEEVWVCALEEVYARLARSVGIDFPESRWFALDNGLSAFGVRRFDRTGSMRIPVMSMAGALQADFTLPCLDYTDILRATGMITRSMAEREIQARRMVFNVILNNRDDHAKNFAFTLNRNGEWQVSPAYDLTFQDGPGGQHQTSVAGYGRDVSKVALMMAAAKADISDKYIKEVIEEVCEAASGFRHFASQPEFDIPDKVVKMVADRIERNIASL